MKKLLFALAFCTPLLIGCGNNDSDKKAEEEKMIHLNDSIADALEHQADEIKQAADELEEALKILEEDTNAVENENE